MKKQRMLVVLKSGKELNMWSKDRAIQMHEVWKNMQEALGKSGIPFTVMAENEEIRVVIRSDEIAALILPED